MDMQKTTEPSSAVGTPMQKTRSKRASSFSGLISVKQPTKKTFRPLRCQITIGLAILVQLERFDTSGPWGDAANAPGKPLVTPNAKSLLYCYFVPGVWVVRIRGYSPPLSVRKNGIWKLEWDKKKEVEIGKMRNGVIYWMHSLLGRLSLSKPTRS